MNNQIKSNDGQTLVEFILLFAITMAISYTMLDLINGNIADLWKEYIQIITNEKPGSFDFN
jgi:hypothetical protein|tara:strand:- start:198 stop:380 length:183 start_codon:yes stop_codon:yes gene_type:complete